MLNNIQCDFLWNLERETASTSHSCAKCLQIKKLITDLHLNSVHHSSSRSQQMECTNSASTIHHSPSPFTWSDCFCIKNLCLFFIADNHSANLDCEIICFSLSLKHSINYEKWRKEFGIWHLLGAHHIGESGTLII